MESFPPPPPPPERVLSRSPAPWTIYRLKIRVCVWRARVLARHGFQHTLTFKRCGILNGIPSRPDRHFFFERINRFEGDQRRRAAPAELHSFPLFYDSCFLPSESCHAAKGRYEVQFHMYVCADHA